MNDFVVGGNRPQAQVMAPQMAAGQSLISPQAAMVYAKALQGLIGGGASGSENPANLAQAAAMPGFGLGQPLANGGQLAQSSPETDGLVQTLMQNLRQTPRMGM